MEIDQLVHFVRVSETLNITKAAQELGLSQPAVSRSLQRLEEELGQPLFERQSRSVSLTDAGEKLLGRARQVLSIIDDTKNEISDDGQSGTLRVGSIPTITPYFLPGLLREFSEHFPRARMIVNEGTTAVLLNKLTQGELDVAILALPITAKYIETLKLFDEELLLVMPTNHHLCKQPSISISDMQSLPFVLLDEAHCLSEQIVSFCRRKSFHPVSTENTSQLATVQELVALNHGISLIPAMAAVHDQATNRIYRSFASPKPKRTIAVAWNAYRFQSRLLQAFHSTLQQYSKTFSFDIQKAIEAKLNG